jgi:hypothetical protein
MKKNLALVFLCFLAGLAGGNVAPILTGSGYIKFPETVPSASLSASGGKLTIASGGTSQHILLMPGGGSVGIAVTDPTFGGKIFPALASVGGTVFAAGSSATTPNFALNVDGSGNWALYDYNAGSWGLGLYQGSTRVGIGGAAGASNQLDVYGLGTINAGSGYKVNNVAGLTQTITVVKTATGATTCTIILTGGLKTGGTC